MTIAFFSATKHDGIFASTNAAFAFNPLQKFVDPTTFANMLAELETEISLKTKTPLQKAQYEIQTRLLVEGAVGQIELALTPGMCRSLWGAFGN